MYVSICVRRHTTLVSLMEGGGNRRVGVHIGQIIIEGCSCRLFFNTKWVLKEGGMHVGSFSIEKEC